MIAVSASYRVNAFGFLGSAELQQSTADGSAGNWGLQARRACVLTHLHALEVAYSMHVQDQKAAMEWVQEHITAFGGNPREVTIFGESAGAADVAYHLSQPQTKGLYAKVPIHQEQCEL